jgi:flagellar hook assembly protein FlgD
VRWFVAVAAALLVAAPGVARAGDVAMRVQEVPLGKRALASVPAAMHFNMLAAHWQGPGSVAYRVHRLHGRWTAWHAVDDDARPDGGTGTWHDGNLDWTGASDRVQFRTSGTVHGLRAYELWSRVTKRVSRALGSAGPPTIVPRSGWAADEEIVRAKPVYAPQLKLAIVHHTAGTNAYSPAQAAAIVRGIEVYHVKGNGWNDIGYNFLVDRYGTVYEGRGGGITRNVVGAHAEGFNRGTVGVALIGNFSVAAPTAAQQRALVKLLAWRLDVAHVDPLSKVVYTSGGNAKYRRGKLVTLRAISGHRDTGPSECPGSAAYAALPSIAKRVAATGLPKLYSPTVAGVLGGPIRFEARLSAPLHWTVAVADQLGHVLATGSGTGTLVDWTWVSLAPGTGAYTWTIAAPGVRVATGTLGVGRPVPPPSLTLTGLAMTPAVVTPNADGSGDVATVAFTLGAAARVTAQVLDATGAQLLTLLDEQRVAGANSFQWAAHVLPDGRYRLVVTARSGTRAVTKTLDVVVDRTLTGLQATPLVISPNGDGVNDSTTLSFVLAQSVPLRLDIEQGGVIVGSPFQGQLDAGPHTLTWDGSGFGAPLFDGTYQAVVTITDPLGDVQLPVPITIDDTPPHLMLVDRATLTFTLDEDATVTALVDQKTRIVVAEKRGTFKLPYAGPAVAQVSAEAQDAAGNVSAIVSG